MSIGSTTQATDVRTGSQPRLTAAVTIAGACAFFPLYATQPLLPMFRKLFAATELRVSLTVSAATIAVALASPVVGLLADSVGRKRVIVPAILLLALPTMLAATARSLDQLILWRFLQGLFVPGIIAVTIAYIAEEASPGAAGSTTAAYVTGTVIGGLLGRLCTALCADHLGGGRTGWRIAFGLLGALTFLGGLAVWRWLPRSRHFRPAGHPVDSLRATTHHLRNPRLIATYFVGFNSLFSLVGLFTYANFYLAGPPFGLSTAALGFVFLVYALGVIVTPASGPLIDRLGHRAALVLASGIVAAGALLTLVHVLAAVIGGLAILSTGVFVCQSAASSHVALAARHTRSAATGLYTSFYYLGGSAGATVLGLTWRVAHWPACVGLVLVLQFLAAATAYLFFSRPGPEPDAALTPIPAEVT